MAEYRFFAFISYRSTDREWAVWLQHMLEHYRLPSVLNGVRLPDSLYPVFLDTSELSGGTLGNELAEALESSRYLIVICSPSSAQSQWVDKEVQSFIDRGEIDRVIPFIISGSPYGEDDNCFVPALTRLRGTAMEQLGISVNENGREPAAVKVIARMLGLRFNDLWKRHEREKEAERQRLVETNNRIRRNLARFVSQKAMALLEQGDGMTALRLSLEALPSAANPDIPVTAEAEAALRLSINNPNRCYAGFSDIIYCMALSPDSKSVAFGDGDGNIRVFDLESSRELHSFVWDSYDYPTALAFSPDGRTLVLGTQCGHIRFFDTATWQMKPVREGIDNLHFDEVNTIVFSPDGRYMVTSYSGISDYSGFVIWDAATLGWLSYVDRKSLFCEKGVSISPDSRHIVCAGRYLSLFTLDAESPTQVWKVRSKCRSNAVFSHDGKHIIYATCANRVCDIDTATGRRLSECIASGDIEHFVVTPDGTQFFCGSTAFTFDAEGSVHLTGSTKAWGYIGAILPANRRRSYLFLSYYENQGFLELYHSTLFYGSDNEEEYISFDADGKPFVCDYAHRAMPPAGFRVELEKNRGRTTVSVFDRDDNVLGCIKDIDLNVEHYALSPDGRYIALYQSDRGGIWSVADGVCVDIPDLERESVDNQIAFSPDGRILAMISFLGGIMSFDFKPLGELIAEARRKCADMPFTAEERRKYYLES